MSYSGDVHKLLDAVTADTNGAAVAIKGGRYRFMVACGSFGSGTATLQWTPDGGTLWASLGTGFAFTANGSVEAFLPGGTYRAVLTGSTAPTALYAWLAQVTS